MNYMLVGVLFLAGNVVAQQTCGYRGDGASVFPDAKPPTSFDEKSGKNVLWKTPLPNWGHCQPIVAGNRVLLTTEPDPEHDFPVLRCFDAETGKEVWARELNHLSAVPGINAAAVQKAFHERRARYHQAYRLAYQVYHEKKSGLEAQFKALGFDFHPSGNPGQPFHSMKDTEGRPDKNDPMKKAGLTLDGWWIGWGTGTGCFAEAFATPVTDGTTVYAVNPYGGTFAFDLAGKQLWVAFQPGTPGEYCRNGRSPILYKDLVISSSTALVRAIDRATGKLRWSAPCGTETIITPVVIAAKGGDALWVSGPKAFLLPGGKELKIAGWKNEGGTAIVKHDERDVVFFTGGGEHGGWESKGKCATPPPAAVRFAVTGDTLQATVLWSGINDKQVNTHTAIVYHDGKLYHGSGCILDAATGKILAGAVDAKKGGNAVPLTGHMLHVAGGHVYGLQDEGGKRASGDGGPRTGVLSVYDLAGKKVAASELVNAPSDAAKRERTIQETGHPDWSFSYSAPFIVAGNRVYVRSHDFLWCLGAK